jgi:hypothetical protein
MLGLDPARIKTVSTRPPDASPKRPETWDGRAAERAAAVVERFLATRR